MRPYINFAVKRIIAILANIDIKAIAESVKSSFALFQINAG